MQRTNTSDEAGFDTGDEVRYEVLIELVHLLRGSVDVLPQWNGLGPCEIHFCENDSYDGE